MGNTPVICSHEHLTMSEIVQNGTEMHAMFECNKYGMCCFRKRVRHMFWKVWDKWEIWTPEYARDMYMSFAKYPFHAANASITCAHKALVQSFAKPDSVGGCVGTETAHFDCSDCGMSCVRTRDLGVLYHSPWYAAKIY